MTKKNKQYITEYVDKIEARLTNIISSDCNKLLELDVADAMKYSLSAGGKRIRPILLMEFCRICGGDINMSIDTACALEMIHTFSLIHDDLPCMDNDDFRRGKPSCHKAYGEAVALLAGDAMQNLAYGIIANDNLLPNDVKVKLISDLSKAVGVNGMIGGQVIDIKQSFTENSDILNDMYSKKTGALLKTACRMGCIIAEADSGRIEYANQYAEKLGLAFQIIDDILDVTSTIEELGKSVGSDEKQQKTTYVTLFGIEEAKKKAETLTNEALSLLENFDNNCFLSDFTKNLLIRKK